MAMSFTFTEDEFSRVIAEWERTLGLLNDQWLAFNELGFITAHPPADDDASTSFLSSAHDALSAASQSGEEASRYVGGLLNKLLGAKKEYLDSDEDGVRRLRITLEDQGEAGPA